MRPDGTTHNPSTYHVLDVSQVRLILANWGSYSSVVSAMNASPVSSRKRQRKEDPDAPNAPTAHPCLYFKDGNLVLVADDTSFRVHDRVLSQNSVLLRNMIVAGSQPSPTDCEKFIEGCPVVRLDDTAEDVAVVLTIMYQSCKMFVQLLAYKI